ncbi:hypothetical protein GCM10007301_41920 [Azorhizobium oxalatiphilum]|uniref:Protease n=1 Tax=Azorhizobium oxalatiphilum TaxID=980631 RepID=A0A917C8F0_9HYPH|nr:protease [Azorhizobium oxalatiphilum]GGF77606.1 hypothetical protein GCM10007301_41920 [Azorhizobium oxalatiphilum]
MIQLALLLIGADAMRRRWWVLAGLGIALLVLAALLVADLVDGLTFVAAQAFGLVFLAQGVVALIGVARATTLGGRLLHGLKAGLMLLAGLLVMGHMYNSEHLLAWLLCISLVLDGLTRIGLIALVRFRRWALSVAIAAAEIGVAILLVAEWPLPHAYNVPVCIAILLMGWGLDVLRIGLWLRREPEEMGLFALPAFGARNWNENAPVLVRSDVPEAPPESPLTVRIWTPLGSAEVTERRPVVDRYLAARDVNGGMSTGHSALEYGALYISHWPGHEIDPNLPVMQLFDGGKAGDMPGLFQPSYAAEHAAWCACTQTVQLEHFSVRRLRAYWAGYRQDATYNLTNRNCSSAVVGALDSALEGVLLSRFPLLRLIALQFNPDLWAAAYLRSRAHSMCWTPGMVLDYAQALKRIVERSRLPWTVRVAAFLTRLKADRTMRETAG